MVLGQANSAETETQLDGGLIVHLDGGSALVGIANGNVSWTDCGVRAIATGDRGAALVATHYAGSTAIWANGKVRLVGRSGRATVPAGAAHVDVTVRHGLAGSPLTIATVQGYRPGVFVTSVRNNYPKQGTARIYLNKAASSATSIAWIVFDA
jgi:hypothetical protein